MKLTIQTHLDGIWHDAALLSLPDPEGVTRSSKWGVPFEEGGNFKWIDIAKALSALASPDQTVEQLKTQAQQLRGLHERLRERGVSDGLLNMPTFGFQTLDNRLKNWGLLP
jgi:serine/threonine-protein kinase HipA